jgi:hypothetical protein
VADEDEGRHGGRFYKPAAGRARQALLPSSFVVGAAAQDLE